jgi:hypothetical protein
MVLVVRLAVTKNGITMQFDPELGFTPPCLAIKLGMAVD